MGILHTFYNIFNFNFVKRYVLTPKTTPGYATTLKNNGLNVFIIFFTNMLCNTLLNTMLFTALIKFLIITCI